MISVRLYLDSRLTKGDKEREALMKIALTKDRKVIYFPTGLKLCPKFWNARAQSVDKHPQRLRLNKYLREQLLQVENMLIEMQTDKHVPIKPTIKEIKTYIDTRLFNKMPSGGFLQHLEKVIADKQTTGTKSVYNQTKRRILAFDSNADSLVFEDITVRWLRDFEAFLAQTASKNARNIHLRNIRAVFNDAINNEVTLFYPFRQFKIRPEATRKRALNAAQLRTIFEYDVEPHAVKYRDMFKLIFLLCGINIVDLSHLSEVREGRIEYRRAKTGRLYSIKVEPEAQEIIDKYKGHKYLLNIYDTYSDYHQYLKYMNKALQRIGPVKSGPRGVKSYEPLFPEITTYWARHSWASIASELDIPVETISAALGHEYGSKTTAIYIDFNQKKVDSANRAVIDYVLYNKLPK